MSRTRGTNAWSSFGSSVAIRAASGTGCAGAAACGAGVGCGNCVWPLPALPAGACGAGVCGPPARPAGPVWFGSGISAGRPLFAGTGAGAGEGVFAGVRVGGVEAPLLPPNSNDPPAGAAAAAADEPKGPNLTPGAAPIRTPEQERAAAAARKALDDGLSKFYGRKKQPPMHTTNREFLAKIVQDGKLEMPAGSGATWSYTGTLRDGDVAIKLTAKGAEKVQLIPTTDAFGQVPQFFEQGIGKGAAQTYIPVEYLEYFNVTQGKWLPLKR